MSPEALAQCDPRNCGYRATGEKIQGRIEWDFAGIPGKFEVYVKASSNGSGTLTTTLQGNQQLFVTTMPSGGKKEYRYFYVPVEINSSGVEVQRWASSEEILILRKNVMTRKRK